MAKNLVTLAFTTSITVIEHKYVLWKYIFENMQFVWGIDKRSNKIEISSGSIFYASSNASTTAGERGAPESPLAFTIPFQSNNLVEAASVRTQVFLLSITRVVLCRWQYIYVLYTLILYFRYSNFEIDITTMHFNFLTLQCWNCHNKKTGPLKLKASLIYCMM